MQTTKSTSKETTSSTLLKNLAVDAIQDIKGNKIISIDLREKDDSPCDFIVICDAESSTQTKAIANNIRRRALDELYEKPLSITGLENGTWVCIDFFAVVIHVFNPEQRFFYDIESIWSDAPVTTYEDL